jgi:hypothetical protein
LFATVFRLCAAFSDGGAVYLLAAANPPCGAKISKCHFVSCASRTVGGALAATSASELEITDCCFDQCGSRLTGGALLLSDCCGRISRSFFLHCRTDKLTSDIPHRHSLSVDGGVAVSLVGTDGRVSFFATDRCVFVDKEVTGDGRGAVAVGGSVHYQSFGDSFSRAKADAVISTEVDGAAPTVRLSRGRFAVGQLDAEQKAALEEVLSGRRRRRPGPRHLSRVDGELADAVSERKPVPKVLPVECRPRVKLRLHVEGEAATPKLGFVSDPPPEQLEPHVDTSHFRILAVLTNVTNLGDRTYSESIVRIFGCDFVATQAVGGVANTGFGGAIFVYRCQLVIDASERGRSSFDSSVALVGGAVAAVDSDVLMRNTDFKACKGYFEGGSVLVRYDGPPDANSLGRECLAFFENVIFNHSISREYHGAIGVIGIADVTMTHVTFRNCHAGLKGGALGAIDSNVIIERSNFFSE